jgi:hypothetical protein
MMGRQSMLFFPVLAGSKKELPDFCHRNSEAAQLPMVSNFRDVYSDLEALLFDFLRHNRTTYMILRTDGIKSY